MFMLIMDRARRSLLFTGIVVCMVLIPAYGQDGSTSGAIERAQQSVALVLVGDGEGAVVKVAPALIIKPDGVLLVPYHVVKNAKEVQVKLKSGEIFDDVLLLGTDARRDAAAIKIQANDLITVEPTSYEKSLAGASAFLITQAPEKLWNVSTGKLGASNLADEIPGAGEGFRVIKIEMPFSGNEDGGILFTSYGSPLAMVTREFDSPAQEGVAVPVMNIKALGDGARAGSFKSGESLKVPSEAVLKANRDPSTEPKNLLLRSKRVYVESRSSLFKEQQLIAELNKRKEIKDWGWVLTTAYDASNKADLIISLDHQILSFDFTFAIRHRKTSVLISSGKVIITDGASGAPIMVDKIIKSINQVLGTSAAKGK
jgi:hypothetical protein